MFFFNPNSPTAAIHRNELLIQMTDNGIDCVPIKDPNVTSWHCSLGEVRLRDGKLAYTHDSSLYSCKIPEMAYELAYQQIKDMIELRKKMASENNSAEIQHLYNGQVTSTETLTGTWDKIFERFEKMRTSLRYSNNSRVKFADEAVEREYNLWSSMIPESRAFALYYGNGIVD